MLIFDMEGTLVDSVPETLQCWKGTFEQLGYDVSLGTLHKHSGRDPDEMIRSLLTPQQARQHADELKREQGRRFREIYLPGIEAFPGVRALFESAREAGCRLALATTCARDELAHYLHLTDLEGLLDAVACGEDVCREKPHPDLIVKALERGGPVSRAVMIGDTPFDSLAARAAGIGAAGVLTDGFVESELREAGCAAVYRDPQHLRERLESLLALEN